MKINKILIMIVIVYSIFLINAIVTNLHEYNTKLENYNYVIENCSNKSFCSNFTTVEQCEAYCNKIEASGSPQRNDFLYTFYDMFYQERTKIIQLLSPILIGFASVWYFLNDLKSKNIKNKLLRIEYKKYFFKNWKKSVLYAFVVPIFCVLLFIASYIMCFNVSLNNISESAIFWTGEKDNIFLTILLNIISIGFQSVLWINIFYIGAKKSKNIILSLIVSYMIFLGLWIVSELTGLFASIFLGLVKEEVALLFSLSSIWSFDGKKCFIIFIYQFILAIISSIFVNYYYSSKEGVLIDNEI